MQTFRHELRSGADERLAELRSRFGAIALASAGAGVAWWIAREATGQSKPFFAPVAAVLALGLSVGHQVSRALEVTLGVALGIVVADGLVLALGDGGWQLVAVLLVTMSVAVLAAGSMLLVNQAAITAIFIVVVEPPHGTLNASRLIDALIGGAVAVAARALFPSDPLQTIRSELTPLTGGAAATLELDARALARSDVSDARAALDQARELDPEPMFDAAAAVRATLSLTPGRRRDAARAERLADAVPNVEHALLNLRVLARTAVSSIERGEQPPQLLTEAIGRTAEAMRLLGRVLAGRAAATQLERAVLAATAAATESLELGDELGVTTIANQVRLLGTDVLLAAGVSHERAVSLVRASANAQGGADPGAPDAEDAAGTRSTDHGRSGPRAS